MKKIALLTLLSFAVASFAFAADGKVVSVDGNKVTVEVKGNKFKAGDAVTIDAKGDKKAKKPRMSGC